MTPLTTIAKFYDQEAKSEYDVGYSTPLCKAEDAIVKEIAKPPETKTPPNELRLDIGCGTGRYLEWFSPTNYLGIDVSPEMIKLAEKRFPKAKFETGDMHKLSIPSNSVGFLISLFGPVSYSLKPDILFKEFNRVLKSGGKFLIMPYTFRIKNNFFLGPYCTAVNPDIPKRFYTKEEIVLLLTKAGFSNIKVCGVSFLGNFMECIAGKLHLKISEQIYYYFLKMDVLLNHIIPAQFARHVVVTGQKPV